MIFFHRSRFDLSPLIRSPLGSHPSLFEDQIPRELIYLVPGPFRKDAAELLRESDLIPLSEQQCRSLSCSSNPNPVLEEVIANPKHELDFILRSGFANATYNKNKYHTGRQLWTYGGNSRTSKHGVVGCVRFLAKTVTLAESASDHSSDSQPHVMGDTLLISHVAEGNRPLPMQNLPVVTFLDRQPANIYREASMKPGNSIPSVPTVDQMEITIEP